MKNLRDFENSKTVLFFERLSVKFSVASLKKRKKTFLIACICAVCLRRANTMENMHG